MSSINATNKLKTITIRSEIKENIFEDIRKRKLFGRTCLWQFYMVRGFMRNYQEELRKEIDLVINNLIENKIFERNEYGYKLTSEGEKIVYESNCYTIDEVVSTILTHLRE